METYFMKLPWRTVPVLMLLRGSLELSSECCNRGEIIFMAILLPMCVYGDCVAVCSILYSCQQRCGWNSRIHKFKGVFTYFVYIAHVQEMTDRGCCVEATVPPSWHSPTIVKNILEAIEMHVLMSTLIFASLMHTLKWYLWAMQNNT
jgi:hypothetical protein